MEGIAFPATIRKQGKITIPLTTRILMDLDEGDIVVVSLYKKDIVKHPINQTTDRPKTMIGYMPNARGNP